MKGLRPLSSFTFFLFPLAQGEMKGRRKGGGGRANKILPDYREGDNGMREWRCVTGKQREEKRGEKLKLFIERRAREASSKVLECRGNVRVQKKAEFEKLQVLQKPPAILLSPSFTGRT